MSEWIIITKLSIVFDFSMTNCFDTNGFELGATFSVVPLKLTSTIVVGLTRLIITRESWSTDTSISCSNTNIIANITGVLGELSPLNLLVNKTI